MLSITPLFCVAKEQALFFSLGVFLIELKLYITPSLQYLFV